MTDCIIIGSGVAGISAGLTLKANGKSFLLLGNPSLSEKIKKAESIRNYPAFLGGTGEAFQRALQDQLQREEIVVLDERATGVYALKEKYLVQTDKGNAYESRSVILATGVENVRAIDGEEAFFGRGVSYCATCDGFLYKGKTIAVVCTTKALEHEIGYLANFAEKVYLVALYKNVELDNENVTVIKKMPKKIDGARRVEKLVFASPYDEKGETELFIDGVFMLKESVAPKVLVGGLETENGYVKVARDMATNLPGCFACGDCTGRPYQYAKAVGEGNVCAHSVSEYLG